MKHNILLKSFLVLTLIFTLSSHAYASEVTGTLSSSNTGNENSTSGSMSGTVSSPPSESGGGDGSSSSSGSRRSTGTVLGASTEPTNATTTNYFSNDGTAFVPSSRSLAISPGTDEATDDSAMITNNEDVLGAETAEAASPTQVAAAGVGLGNLSGMAWFWIILLILLLLAVIIYVYTRQGKSRTRIP
ncbi:MAG: hypothetical protein WCT44_02285 [Candidatus Paceibacterota bacterium]